MHADILKEKLFHIIDEMAEDPSLYAKNPGVDFTRNRKLPFESLVKFIICMCGGSINKELYDYFGKENPENMMTASAFVQQRDKLRPETFEHLFREFNNACQDNKTMNRYHLYAVDGTELNVALDENADTYIANHGNPYNQYHVTAMYDLLNKTYVDAIIQPQPVNNERKAMIEMLERHPLPEHSIVIADRGYESINLYEHINRLNGVDFVIRVQSRTIKEICELPMEELDTDISFELRTTRTKEDIALWKAGKAKLIVGKSKNGKPKKREVWDFESPFKMSLRVVRFKINDNGINEYETLVTSLNRFEFPLEKIKELYRMRWGIETSFRELKYAIGLTNFHAKKSDSIKQEIFAKLIAYNFCERITKQIVIKQDENRKHTYQVNFSMAIYLCMDFLRFHGNKAPPNVEQLIMKYILPIREGRTDKRKMKAKSVVWFLYRVA